MNVWAFTAILWCSFMRALPGYAEQSSSFFIRSVFENGISVSNFTSPTIRGCLANCRSMCSAVKYNPQTNECRLLAHVLLTWPLQENVEAEEKSYVKVRDFLYDVSLMQDKLLTCSNLRQKILNPKFRVY